ncbi:hypothetical protein PDE_02110 [Penicillium oxalicum 114-2]|uniref:Uncharacterized protein n=1 Tax=Penicillium oxalicum (strain 114-2 / CGMCC 5302) TaxID=933388 RepID=S8AYV8_PENO1|nr:hypothetical protein PDE_02110 [Penicillium oxalicum 114-2]
MSFQEAGSIWSLKSPICVCTEQHANWSISDKTVAIVGTGAYYPPNRKSAADLKDIISKVHELDSIFNKILEINDKSMIKTRHFAIPDDHPYWGRPEVPTIAECDVLFKLYGAPMAETAAKKALDNWGGSMQDITHLVVVTCTNTANPGLDFHLSQKLGLSRNVHRILLHGIGCAGGVAALRTANELLLGAAFQAKAGRALVVACELTSIYCRTELADIERDHQVNVGVTLFGDGAGALVLSNSIGVTVSEKESVWNILNARSTVIKGSEQCLEYNVHARGYHAVISKDVPSFIRASISQGFEELIRSTPSLCRDGNNFVPSNYDWALHPGGYGVLVLAEQELGLSQHHLRKSHEVYRTRGNISSVTVLGVIDELAKEDVTSSSARRNVIVCSFGPGMTMEMAVMSRHNHGR